MGDPFGLEPPRHPGVPGAGTPAGAAPGAAGLAGRERSSSGGGPAAGGRGRQRLRPGGTEGRQPPERCVLGLTGGSGSQPHPRGGVARASGDAHRAAVQRLPSGLELPLHPVLECVGGDGLCSAP